MVSIISKYADNLNSFRSIFPERSDKSSPTSTSFIKSENMDTNFVNFLNNKSFKSSIPSSSSSVLSLVKNHSSNLNGKSTMISNQLNLCNNHRSNNNNNNNVINLNNQQQPQRNDNMNHQIKLVNNQKKRYSCDQCSYSTDRRDLYRRHENIHRDEKPFRCYVCNKMFNRADHVKKHFLRIHKGLEYNVKLIKRINGVDYTNTSNILPNGSPNANNNSINNNNINNHNSTESTILNNNNIYSDKNNNSNNNTNNSINNVDVNLESQTNGLKSLPTFNLALWNEESNRLLFENYNSQSMYPQTKFITSSRQSQSQSQSPSHCHPQLSQLSHHSIHKDREPLGDSNGQSNDQRDLLNIMKDAGLTLCLKLNGSSTEVNGRASKLSSHSNSPRSTPPTPSPSPPFNDVRAINIFKSPIIRNQENRRTPYDIRSVYSTQSHRRSTSLLSPINSKTLSPPQTIATSLVKPKCPDKNENSHQYGQHRGNNTNVLSQAHHKMTITSLKEDPSKTDHNSNIIEKVDEMIKMSENEFNRRLLESMSSSSSSALLAERDSFPHSTLIFNTETSNNTKKTNWFNRLNPVRVNTVSSVSTNNNEYLNSKSDSSNSQSPINNNYKYSDKYFEEEITSESFESDEFSIDEFEDFDSEDNNYLEITEHNKDEDDDKSDIYLHDMKSNTYDCEYCGCSFANYKSLHTHRYLLHQYISKQNNLYPYSCVICGKRSSTQKQMINHMINHNGLKNTRKYTRNSNISSASASIKKNRRKQSQPKRVAISISNSNY